MVIVLPYSTPLWYGSSTKHMQFFTVYDKCNTKAKSKWKIRLQRPIVQPNIIYLDVALIISLVKPTDSNNEINTRGRTEAEINVLKPDLSIMYIEIKSLPETALLKLK